MSEPVLSDPVASGSASPDLGAAEGLVFRRNRPVALSPLADWFLDLEDMRFVHPFARFPFQAEEWDELLTRPSPFFYYAEVDGAPFAHFGLRDNDGAGHLCFLVMDPARRGSGLAKPLIRLTAAAARARFPGAERMTLNVSDGNARAERLYSGLGFARNGIAYDGMFQMARPLAAAGRGAPRDAPLGEP